MDELNSNNNLEKIPSNQYVINLAKVNKTNDVIASGDIKNSRGILIACKGTHLNHDQAEKISHQTLETRIEDLVNIDDSVNVSSLMRLLDNTVLTLADITIFESMFHIRPILEDVFIHHPTPPVIFQKLTVYQQLYPKKMEQTLFSVWLSCLLASQMKLDSESIASVVIAALIRDIGLLHLPPVLMEKTGAYSAEEWRAMKSHVIVGKMIATETKGLDSSIATAILEHHERYDGSGYPTKLSGKKLNLNGQILAISDTITAIHYKENKLGRRNLYDALAMLQINASSYHPYAYSAFYSCIKLSGIDRTNTHPFNSTLELARHVLQQTRKLNCVRPHMHTLSELQSTGNRSENGDELITQTTQTLNIIHQSGLTDDKVIRWLEEIIDNNADKHIGALTEIDLQQSELFWHIKKIRKLSDAFQAANKVSDEINSERIMAQLDRLAVILDPTANAKLTT